MHPRRRQTYPGDRRERGSWNANFGIESSAVPSKWRLQENMNHLHPWRQKAKVPELDPEKRLWDCCGSRESKPKAALTHASPVYDPGAHGYDGPCTWAHCTSGSHASTTDQAVRRYTHRDCSYNTRVVLS